MLIRMPRVQHYIVSVQNETWKSMTLTMYKIVQYCTHHVKIQHCALTHVPTSNVKAHRLAVTGSPAVEKR
jgi:hypothetical protein